MSLLCIVYAKGFSQTTDPSTDNTGSFNVIRSTIGISGSSNTISTANGNYIISQSIGQSSIIGTGSNAGYTLRQGYQQPSILADAPSGNDNDKLEAKIYPNPFNHSIYISFSERITKSGIKKISVGEYPSFLPQLPG